MKTSQTQLSKEDQAIKRLFQELFLFQNGLEDNRLEFDLEKNELNEIIRLIDELMDQLIRYYDFED